MAVGQYNCLVSGTDLAGLFESILYPPRLATSDPSKFVPVTLYHYTGASGVTGILQGSCLWATNFSFLNDPSEVQYGRDLVLDILHREQRRRHDREILFEEIKQRFTNQDVSEVYICCFTECFDDLGQWRAYGTATGARFCIGFDSEVLHACAHALPGATFTRIIYEEQGKASVNEFRR